MATLIVPTPLRKFTNNEAKIEIIAQTVQEAIHGVVKLFPSLKKSILDDDGRLKNFVRIYVGDEDIKALQNENTPVENDSIISLIPAIAGGSNSL